MRSGWSRALVRGAVAVSCAMSVACGGDGPASSTGTGSGGGGAGGGAGGSEVPLVDTALDGQCPAGSKAPGTGVPPGDDLHRVTLADYPDALCNDGSPAVMFVRRAASPAEEQDWVIHLQAGGGCSSWDVCRDRWCSFQSPYDAAKMSTRFAPEVTNGSGLFARNPSNAFGRANQVYVYYCSSDGWMGRRSDVVLDDPAGVGPSYRIHFRGFDIAQAMVQELKRGTRSDDGVESLPLLDDASRVLLSGSSAGAQGVTQLLDWFREQLPNAQVAGMMDAITDPLPEDVADPTVRERWQLGIETRHAVLSELYDPFLDESCLAAHSADEAYLCSFFTHVRLEHITTPFFVRQDLRDPVQFGYYQETGAALDDFATAVHLTMTRFPAILSTAEERDDMLRPPGVHVSNCAQHIVMLDNAWFGVAQANNHTVENAAAAPLTLHDALGAWVMGSAVEAIDTHPSSIAVCPSTTNDQ